MTEFIELLFSIAHLSNTERSLPMTTIVVWAVIFLILPEEKNW